MKRSELKNIIQEAVTEVAREAIGLGVAESTPPNFPQGIKNKVFKQYGKDSPKAYATMWAIKKKLEEGDKRVKEMWMAFENKEKSSLNENITSNKQIADLLERGKEVISVAAGRMGKVIKVEGNDVYIEMHGKSGKVGVTSFTQGDPVHVEEKNGKFFIMNSVVPPERKYSPVKCKKCGKEFVPSYGEFSRCPTCLGKQLSAAEKATGVQEDLDPDQEEREKFDRGITRYNKSNSQRYPCPNCKKPNALSAWEKKQGYQCSACADREEGVRFDPMDESWGVKNAVHPSKKGMFKGKNKGDLKSQLSKLKASGPHERGSAADTKEKELNFALRAKNGWGSVTEHDEANMNDPEEKREVEIAEEILKNCKRADQRITGMTRGEIEKIERLAEELLDIHTKSSKLTPRKLSKDDPEQIHDYDPYKSNDYVKENEGERKEALKNKAV